ncbi:MAG: DUF2783 domain-containing protein [Pseudomonadota bacterium]
MPLNLKPNIADPDGFYEHLVSSQRHMSDDEANRMNTRLILILSNQIGDTETLKAAIDLAADPKPSAA